MKLQTDEEAVYFASDTNDNVVYIMEDSVFVKGENFCVVRAAAPRLRQTHGHASSLGFLFRLR